MTITPNKDTFEAGLAKMRAHILSQPITSEIDALERQMMIDVMEAVMRPLGDMLDRHVPVEAALSYCENAFANAIGSVSMTMVNTDQQAGWRVTLSMLAGIKNRLKTRLGDLKSEHVVMHRGRRERTGTA